MGRINSRNTTVTFLDSDETNSITVGPGPGDFNISNLGAYLNEEILEATNRTAHDGFATGNQLRQELSGTLEIDGKLTATDEARILDWFRRTGRFDPDTGSVALTSVDACSWAWKVRIESTFCGQTVSITLPKFRGMVTFAESDTASTMSISGTNYVAPVYA